MANPNIQGVIPLKGPGFKRKVEGVYGPGEFSTLRNLEIYEGAIVCRRNILADGISLPGAITNAKFLGEVGDNTLLISDGAIRTTVGGTLLWGEGSLAAPASGSPDDFHILMGAYEYNGEAHFISQWYNGTTGDSRIYIHVGGLFDAFGTYTTTLVFDTTTTGTLDRSNFRVIDYFVQGERLWIITPKRILFSKATDHSVWAVPEGGFFRLPDETFTGMAFLRNSIYALSTKSLHLITYDLDPNTDSSIVKISNSGGSDICSHLDHVYYVSELGVFGTNGSTVLRVIDNEFDVVFNVIKSFNDYLVLFHRTTRFPTDNDARFPLVELGGAVTDVKALPFNSTYDDNKDILVFINMENGSAHSVFIDDQYEITTLYGDPGYISDVFVSSRTYNYTTPVGTQRFYMLTAAMVAGDDFSSGVYYMESERQEAGLDYILTGRAPTGKDHIFPESRLEINGYTPDYDEYRFKKFRSFMMMGQIPNNMYLEIFYDFRNPLLTPSSPHLQVALEALDEADIGLNNNSRPNPYRVGLNQRSRGMSVVLRTDFAFDRYAVPEGWFDTVISDIKILWSYSKSHTPFRAPHI